MKNSSIIIIIIAIAAALALGADYTNNLLPRGQGDLTRRVEAWQYADIERKNELGRIADAIEQLVRLQATGQPDGSSKLNINTATFDQISSLPRTRMGPVLAQRIVDYRENNGPFAAVSELTNVEGVGAATVAVLQDYIGY